VKKLNTYWSIWFNLYTLRINISLRTFLCKDTDGHSSTILSWQHLIGNSTLITFIKWLSTHHTSRWHTLTFSLRHFHWENLAHIIKLEFQSFFSLHVLNLKALTGSILYSSYTPFTDNWSIGYNTNSADQYQQLIHINELTFLLFHPSVLWKHSVFCSWKKAAAQYVIVLPFKWILMDCIHSAVFPEAVSTAASVSVCLQSPAQL